MLKHMTAAVAFLVPFVAGFPAASYAQVTANILLRVFLLKADSQSGTAFTIEVGGLQYLVTSKHLVEMLPKKAAEVQVYCNRGWEALKVDILECENPQVDIAVLKIPKKLSVTFDLEPTLGGITLGQEVNFLGFPFGMFTIYTSEGFPMPLVKRGIVSALDISDRSRQLFYIDGFNNPGFSGGPIVFYDLETKRLKVGGVVSGYRGQEDRVRLGPLVTDLTVLSNSGILIGYSIEHAVDAIRKSVEHSSHPKE